MASQQNDLPALPRTFRFTTQGIAPVSRVRLWESHNAKALISLDIRTIDESPLHAAEVNLQFPSLRLAQVQGTAQIVERSESFIRQNPTDVVAILDPFRRPVNSAWNPPLTGRIIRLRRPPGDDDVRVGRTPPEECRPLTRILSPTHHR